MPTFSTDFAPPPQVSGLEIEADLARSVVTLTWDVTPTAEVDFGGYRVYRSTDGLTFTQVAAMSATTDVSYEDFEAPLGVSLTYRVTQSNLDFESEPAEGSVMLDSRAWWIVVPEDDSMTFPIPKIRGASVMTTKAQDVFRAIGRPASLVVGDVVHTDDGSLSFLVMPDNPSMVSLLKRVMAKMQGTVILKSPDGEIHYVQYGDMSRTYTNIPGMLEVTIPFYGAS